MSSSAVIVRFNRLPAIAKALEPLAGLAVAKAAHDIEAHAKARAPVDTGALANSIEARELTLLSWVVAVGVFYGIYQEFGTFKMAPRPYLVPAFETVAPGLQQAIAALLKAGL